MASTVSGKGIDHYKWHRLLSRKASTVKNGIACLRKGKLRRRRCCWELSGLVSKARELEHFFIAASKGIGSSPFILKPKVRNVKCTDAQLTSIIFR